MNPNTAKNNNFKLLFSRFESIEFFSKDFIFPGISAGFTELEHGKFDIPVQGSSILFPEIELPFTVNSDMSNYMTMYSWILSNSYEIDNTTLTILFLDDFSSDVKSAIFFDVFPTNLGKIDFSTRKSEDIETSVVLRYSSWEFKK